MASTVDNITSGPAKILLGSTQIPHTENGVGFDDRLEGGQVRDPERTRYLHEQGMTAKKVPLDGLFLDVKI